VVGIIDGWWREGTGRAFYLMVGGDQERHLVCKKHVWVLWDVTCSSNSGERLHACVCVLLAFSPFHAESR